MRVLCDVHIPYRLVNFLRERGMDATHVNRILDGWYTKDSEIVRYVDETGSFLITKDADFRDSHFIAGKPARAVRVTLGNLSNDQLIALYDHHWVALRSIFEEARCYVEIGAGGLRVFRSCLKTALAKSMPCECRSPLAGNFGRLPPAN